MGDYNEIWFANTRVQTTNLKRLEEKGSIRKENQKGRTLKLIKDENGENVAKK